ncbi:MAG: hypothetical protein LBK73_03895 [Treponema sp.]|jgi:hypothetical protein|nr:hypothetical protein [Treponema sp.]
MSVFKEEIMLENVIDRGLANRGYIKESEMRALTVQAAPDTGAWTLVVNEDARQTLRLAIVETAASTLADGKTDMYNVTEDVKIQWKNRRAALPAVAVPNAKDMLPGALPFEYKDAMVGLAHERLVGVRGDQPLHIPLLCQARPAPNSNGELRLIPARNQEQFKRGKKSG